MKDDRTPGMGCSKLALLARGGGTLSYMGLAAKDESEAESGGTFNRIISAFVTCIGYCFVRRFIKNQMYTPTLYIVVVVVILARKGKNGLTPPWTFKRRTHITGSCTEVDRDNATFQVISQPTCSSVLFSHVTLLTFSERTSLLEVYTSC